MSRALVEHGQEGRNTRQLELLHAELQDALSGLAFLRASSEVDARRIATIGHSFGGSLTLLLAERDTAVRAAVVFSAAGFSWNRSPGLRAQLVAAVGKGSAATLFIHAANDFSVEPGETMAAEMTRRGKPNRLIIYPPIGTTSREGHDFVHLGVAAWERDVFAFLGYYLRS
jgi:dipeptidyl aminopeptidase/acylaminoacyl peptidase